MLSAIGYKRRSKYTKVKKETLLEVDNEELELEPVATYDDDSSNDESNDTKIEIKKELSQLSNKTKVANIKTKDEQLIDDIKMKPFYWGQLNDLLDTYFPTLEILKKHAEDTGKSSFCVLDRGFNKLNNKKVHKIVISSKIICAGKRSSVPINLATRLFDISAKNSWFTGDDYPFNMEKNAISYKYLYHYMKNKTVPGLGKPKTQNTKYGLYYVW